MTPGLFTVCDLDIKFAKYHALNAEMFDAYVRYGNQVVAYHGKIGISVIAERIRWDTLVEGTGAYKVQNSYRAYYARLLMWKHPVFRGKFRLRRIPIDGECNLDDVFTWPAEYWGLLK